MVGGDAGFGAFQVVGGRLAGRVFTIAVRGYEFNLPFFLGGVPGVERQGYLRERHRSKVVR